jgi:hypothetical protein
MGRDLSVAMHLPAFLALFCPVLLSAQDAQVLFIGNSYTGVNDLPGTFQQLALSMGRSVDVAASAPGGFQLIQHSAHAPTLDLIASQPWDFVALQEQSQMGAFPFNESTTDEGAAALVDSIRAHHPCATPAFYMTWGRENGDDLNCPNYPPVCTYEGMQQALTDNYVQLALDNDAITAPVGAAWRTVRETQPQIDLYAPDGSHPTLEGTYLAACVFYASLFRESCTDANYTAGLASELAATLREIASATVLEEPDAWNLAASDAPDATPLTSSSNAWNQVSYHHGGAGTHAWTADNGQSFNTPDALFTFAQAGTWTISHIFTNACGSSDTATWSVDITATGLQEYMGPDGPQAWAVPGGLFLDHLPPNIAFSLHTLDGRMVLQARFTTANARLDCPPGAYAWRVQASDGHSWSGLIAVGREE